MKTVLMVAEKPSLAQSIADLLSNGRCQTRRSVSKACPVHEYSGTFLGFPAFFKMTCVVGHVYSTDFAPRYQNWGNTDELTLFGAETQKEEANPSTHVVSHLKAESQGIDYLVLWLDCDREGENICFEVISIVAKNIAGNHNLSNVFRAKFSAITATDIQRAMDNLAKPNELEALSVDARQELDLKVGVAFTRYQTKFFSGKYTSLDAKLISYGPCQTPTLGFCVKRHDDILWFKPEPFWKLVPRCFKGGHTFTLEWDRGRLFDLPIAQLIHSMVADKKAARVMDVNKRKEAKARPGGMNTVAMLKAASSRLGIGPHEAMKVAEHLYTSGYLSYPRTESTKFHPSFDLSAAVSVFQPHPLYGAFARRLLRDGVSAPRGGIDVGDHPPITPMKSATENELGGGNYWRLYDYIVRQFLASVSADCKYIRTKVVLRIGDEAFQVVGRQMEEPGFIEITPWAMFTESRLPDLKSGDEVEVQKLDLKAGKTEPPDYLTESELITLMEKNGIGTDASIPTHINNICERGYVSIQAGRRVVPTKLGIIVVHGYHRIDSELVLPKVRAHIEEEVNNIAAGDATIDDIVPQALSIFKAKFEYFQKHIELMDELMEASYTQMSNTVKTLTRCGVCLRYMKLFPNRPQRLYCGNCDQTYSLPQGGSIKEYKGLECPLDNFQLVVFQQGGESKVYTLCPYCYNNPPFEDVPGGMGCNSCRHPTCKHSLVHNRVCACQDPVCDGFLVLDPVGARVQKMDCNRCNRSVKFPTGTKKVSVTANDTCEGCGSNILHLKFEKDKSPLTGHPEEYSGCILCDDELNALAEEFFGKGKSRGKGKGRGKGRGRGRGKSKGHRGP